MNTDLAREIVAAHDRHDRALTNLRNAAAMTDDDPRSTEMLERAGDAYAESLNALRNVNLEAVPILMLDGTLITHGRGELGAAGDVAKPSPAEPPEPAPDAETDPPEGSSTPKG